MGDVLVEIGYKEWDEKRSHQEKERTKYRAHAQARRRRKVNIVFLEHLQHDTPSFDQWLQMRVKDQVLVGIIVHEDIVQLLRPPTEKASRMKECGHMATTIAWT
jgi:hypothetical protein